MSDVSSGTATRKKHANLRRLAEKLSGSSSASRGSWPQHGVATELTLGFHKFSLERWAQPLGDLKIKRAFEVKISNDSGI